MIDDVHLKRKASDFFMLCCVVKLSRRCLLGSRILAMKFILFYRLKSLQNHFASKVAMGRLVHILNSQTTRVNSLYLRDSLCHSCLKYLSMKIGIDL